MQYCRNVPSSTQYESHQTNRVNANGPIDIFRTPRARGPESFSNGEARASSNQRSCKPRWVEYVDYDGRWHQSAFQRLQGRPTNAKLMTPTAASLKGKYRQETGDDSLISPVSMTPEEFTRQHGPHPGHVITWHGKRVTPPTKLPLTLFQRLLPWTRPQLTDAEKWMRRQFD